MQITQGIRRAVQIRGSAIATVFGERRRTWSDFEDRVSRYAAGLKSFGLQRGDRVAIIAHNSDCYIEAYYAIAWAGGVSVPGNFRWTESEHIFALKDSSPRILIVDGTFEALGAAVAKACGISTLLLMDASKETKSSDGIGSEDLIRTNQPVPDECGRNDDLCAIFYTGGTTGRSKGVMLSHRGLLTNFFAVNSMAPYPPDPVFLHSPPMFHLADASALLAVTMYAGTHIVIPSFSPAAVLEAIDKERVTAVTLVPTMFAMLRDYLRTSPADLSSVRRVRYGASAVSEAVLRDAMKMFPNAEFQQAYGQTELSPCATLLEPRFHKVVDGKSYLRSAGRPIMGVDLRIVDDALVELPRGQVGEIIVSSSGVMLGYWNQPELTAATIVNGWVRTGDAGYMDEEGFVYIADRLKDMIVSGGENVYSAEVENALYAHAAIAECAVIGVPDSKWGERVHAIVRIREGASTTTDEIISHCKTRIASYKCPRTIEIRVEPLPLSSQGKIMKSELRRPYWEGHDRQVG